MVSQQIIPFNSIEWIHGVMALANMTESELSIPLNGFYAEILHPEKIDLTRSFNSIEWILRSF